MTSFEIAELTGKRHKDVLKAIRNMEPAWVKVQGRNFALLHGIKGVAFRDALGREQIVISRDRNTDHISC